ncbi:MAG: hypothetical protein Ct9H300mP28_36710 [Pseudomonadota bacterium]|nr:MAG: hypothetical protein Ct9H300mP28_36710 [Pseudomonadota bacterium]
MPLYTIRKLESGHVVIMYPGLKDTTHKLEDGKYKLLSAKMCLMTISSVKIT